MILHSNKLNRSFSRRLHAMTLVEMMIALSIFSLGFAALIYVNLFGLKQDELAQSKLGASDDSRRGFGELARDIRSAKRYDIGNGSATTFDCIPNGTDQIGNALRLCHSTDTNRYIRYYFDTAAGELCRVRSDNPRPVIVARYLTNSMVFQAEEYNGQVQSDLSHKGVIHVMFDFYQYQYPLTRVGPKYYYDRYKLEFRLTPHAPDGQ